MVTSRDVKEREERARARIEALVADPGQERPWRASRVLIAGAVFAATIALAWWCLGALVDRHPGIQLDETSYQRSKAIYFAAIGGAAALIADSIKEAEVIAYDDLGAEALRKLRVEDFPAIVVNDMYGGDAYEQGKAKHRMTKDQ